MQFGILGPLEVLDDGRRVALGGDKQRALLALLVIHANQTLSSERLIDELWGERPPASAAKTLQAHISRLRKSLDQSTGGEAGGSVVTREHGYELSVDRERVDALRFERLLVEVRRELAAGCVEPALALLEEALSLWRGPPLAEFAYERFAELEIARLEELRVCALEELAEAKLALGRHAEVVGELESLISEQPYRERLRAQLMLALYRCDRQAEALQAYQDARLKLVEELGIEPGERLRELEQAILAQDPKLAFVARQAAVAQPVETSRSVFVGRERELSELLAALDDVINGQGRLALLAGEPGIGKSRLAEELTARADARGALVLVGRCWEAGGAPAYWPWVQTLRAYMRERETAALRSELGAGASDLAQIIPELRQRFPDLADPLALDPEAARFRMFDAAAEFLRNASKTRPLVVVLDDLHAADAPSLLLLRFLARELGGLRVLIVGAYRDIDPIPEAPVREMVAEVTRGPVTRRISLTGLSEQDIGEYVELTASERASPELAGALHAETEGNPLFVGEIVRLLEAEGRLERSLDEPRRGGELPDNVREVIDQRLRRLTTDCQRLLGVASTLGREFGIKELAAVAEIDEEVALELFDEAITARVLAEAPTVGRLRFSHALVRDTLYEALIPRQRRAAHLRAGEVLERLGASDPERYLAEVAHHFFEALPSGDAGRAVDCARSAGDHAVVLLAYEEAARLYALALQGLDTQARGGAETRCAVLVALGDASARAGDGPAAREAFLKAAALASSADLPVLQAQAALGYGGRLVWSRAYDDTHLIPLLESALQALPSEASALRVRVMARLAGALRDHPSRDRRASLSEQAVEIARGLDDPATLAYALDGHYSALLWPETAEQRLTIADEIVTLAEQVDDIERAAAGRLYRVIANMELGRMIQAERELDIIANRAATLRQPAQLWMATASRANLALFQGRFDQAQTLIDEALTLGERAQRRDAVLSHRLQLFLLDRETGGNPNVEALIKDAVSMFPTRPVFRCALAYIHAHLRDTSRAQAEVDDLAAEDFAAVQRDNEYLFSLAFVADAVDTLADVRAAAVLYDLLVPYAHLNAMNADEVGVGSVSRTLGVLAAALSRWDDAARHFDAASVHNQHTGALPWLAHTQHDYARMLLARDMPGDREHSQQLLIDATEQYGRLGMTPWLCRAFGLLER